MPEQQPVKKTRETSSIRIAAEQSLVSHKPPIAMEKAGLPPKNKPPTNPKPSGKQAEESIMNLVGTEPAPRKQETAYDQYKGKSIKELEAMLDQYKKGNVPAEHQAPMTAKIPTTTKEPVPKESVPKKP